MGGLVVRFFTSFLAVAFLAFSSPAFAIDMADPKPDMDNPRKIVLQLTEDDDKKVNGVLYNAINIQKYYGMDNVMVAVVAYAKGVNALLKESTTVADRIASLQQYDVEFVACGNTLDTMGKKTEDLLDGVVRVQAGIPEIVERQLRGWIYITP